MKYTTNFKFFLVFGTIGLCQLFTIQFLSKIKNMLIVSGTFSGDRTATFFSSSLLIIPVLFFIISFIFLMLFIKKDLEK